MEDKKLADELNEKEKQDLAGEAGEAGDLVAPKDKELQMANARLVELEQAVAGRESEIAALKQAQVELEARLARLGGSLTGAVNAYKTLVIQANPEIVEGLIDGDSIESVDESLKKAKALVSKVRQGLEAEVALTRFPAGAPERRAPDLSTLSPREKIQYAIGGKR